MVRLIVVSVFFIIVFAFIVEELKIQELEQEIDDQEIIIKNQQTLYNVNDSLKFQCKTKDILILKLKLINDGTIALHN
jgi:hypothetical protein